MAVRRQISKQIGSRVCRRGRDARSIVRESVPGHGVGGEAVGSESGGRQVNAGNGAKSQTERRGIGMVLFSPLCSRIAKRADATRRRAIWQGKGKRSEAWTSVERLAGGGQWKKARQVPCACGCGCVPAEGTLDMLLEALGDSRPILRKPWRMGAGVCSPTTHCTATARTGHFFALLPYLIGLCSSSHHQLYSNNPPTDHAPHHY